MKARLRRRALQARRLNASNAQAIAGVTPGSDAVPEPRRDSDDKTPIPSPTPSSEELGVPKPDEDPFF